MFNQGDLVHIPENVTLYSYLNDYHMVWPTSKTTKAHLGVFIEYCDTKYAEILSETGEKIIVEKQCLYFQEVLNAC